MPQEIERQEPLVQRLGYRLDNQGESWSASRDRKAYLLESVQISSGVYPAFSFAPTALSLWVKLSGQTADHSYPISAEIEHVWTYTSIPPYAFTMQSAFTMAMRNMSQQMFIVRCICSLICSPTLSTASYTIILSSLSMLHNLCKKCTLTLSMSTQKHAWPMPTFLTV